MGGLTSRDCVRGAEVDGWMSCRNRDALWFGTREEEERRLKALFLVGSAPICIRSVWQTK